MELIGRRPELAACKEALSGERDHAIAVIIAGPPGIGKTSVWRAIADCQSSGAVVLRTTGVPGACGGLANIADLLDPVLNAALPAMPAPLAGALRAALGQVSPQAPVTDMLLERAIVGVLGGLAARGVVIAIDDEQWLDEDSRRLLEVAVVRLAGVPVRWLVSVRPEYVLDGLPRVLCHELGQGAVRVDVGGLDDGVLSELVMARFPGRWSPGVLRQVITLAAGSPYAAVELARETVACGEQAGTTARVPASLALAVPGRLAAHAQAASRWSRGSGHGWSGPIWVASLVKAGYGETTQARTLAAGGLREAEAQRDWAYAAHCRWVLGQLELSVDDPEAALRWLEPVSDMLQSSGTGEPGCYAFTPDLIEAWARTGQLAAAADRLAWLQDSARRLDHPWARITSGRAEAVLRLAEHNPAQAVDAVAGVIPEARDQQLPLELGRCLLVLGTAQRKARQRREAAVSLDEAIATFAQLGAARWQELAHAQRERLAPGCGDDTLTPTERRVAELVAAGHTNPEIAAALFISVKTVEANLTRIYRKLGLRGRVDLARHSHDLARHGQGYPGLAARVFPDARGGAARAI